MRSEVMDSYGSIAETYSEKLFGASSRLCLRLSYPSLKFHLPLYYKAYHTPLSNLL